MTKVTRKAILEYFADQSGEPLEMHHKRMSWSAANSKVVVIFAFSKEIHPHDHNSILVSDIDPDEKPSFSQRERLEHIALIESDQRRGIVVVMNAKDDSAHPIEIGNYCDYMEVLNVKHAHGRIFLTGKYHLLPDSLTK